MSASARSIRMLNKTRRRVTIELRVPDALACLLRNMTAAEREHFVTVAVKRATKEQQP